MSQRGLRYTHTHTHVAILAQGSTPPRNHGGGVGPWPKLRSRWLSLCGAALPFFFSSTFPLRGTPRSPPLRPLRVGNGAVGLAVAAGRMEAWRAAESEYRMPGVPRVPFCGPAALQELHVQMRGQVPKDRLGAGPWRPPQASRPRLGRAAGLRWAQGQGARASQAGGPT